MVAQCREKLVNWKKETEGDENTFFKSLADRFPFTSKLIRCVKEQQQNYLWQLSMK